MPTVLKDIFRWGLFKGRKIRYDHAFLEQRIKTLINFADYGIVEGQVTPYGDEAGDQNRTHVPKSRYQLVDGVEKHARAMKHQSFWGHMWPRS